MTEEIYEVDLGGFSSSEDSDSADDAKSARDTVSTGTGDREHSLSRSSGKTSRSASVGTTQSTHSLVANLYDPNLSDLTLSGGSTSRRNPHLDFTSGEFDPRRYVDKQCAECTVNELVQLDNTLNKDIKALDSEMQMMVYDNYTKFISATDTIREMKGKVESMQSEMSRLLDSMNDIEQGCQVLETKLEPNRNEIEKLVSVRSLLTRLKFLFELPERLTASIRIQAYRQAVDYYRKSTAILNKYSAIPSFARIKEQADLIIDDLIKNLNFKLVQSTTPLRSQLEYAQLMLDLGKPASHLWYDIFFARKAAFMNCMGELMKSDKLSAYYARLSQLSANNDSGGDDTPIDSAQSHDERTLAPDEITDGSVVSTLEYFSVVEFFRVKFMQDFISFTEQFSKIFLPKKKVSDHKSRSSRHRRRHRSSSKSGITSISREIIDGSKKKRERDEYHSKSGGGDAGLGSLGGDESEEDLAWAALSDFSRTVFDRYFECIKECLLREESIDKLTEELQTFYDGLYDVSKLVPSVKLRERGCEIIEECIRHSILKEFVLTQKRNLSYFAKKFVQKIVRHRNQAVSEDESGEMTGSIGTRISADGLGPDLGGSKMSDARSTASDISTVISGEGNKGDLSIDSEITQCVELITSHIRECLNRLVPLTTSQSTLIPMLDLNFDDELWVYTCALIEDLCSSIVPFEYTFGVASDETSSRRSRDRSSGTGSSGGGIYTPRLIEEGCSIEVVTSIISGAGMTGRGSGPSLALDDGEDALTYTTLTPELGPLLDELRSDFGLLLLSKVFLGIASNTVPQITVHFRRNFLAGSSRGGSSVSKSGGRQSSSSMTLYTKEEARLAKLCREASAGLRLMFAEYWADKISAEIITSESQCESLTIEALREGREMSPPADTLSASVSHDSYSDGALAMAASIRLVLEELCQVYSVSAFQREWKEVSTSIVDASSKQRDIDRFFSDKPPIMARVDDDAAGITFTVFKIVLKEWAEHLRCLTIRPSHLQRIQTDLDLIRNRIPKLLDSKDSQNLDLLFDEVLVSAQARTFGMELDSD